MALLPQHQALHYRPIGSSDPNSPYYQGRKDPNAPNVDPSDARDAYDMYARISGRPTSTDYFKNWLGMGGTDGISGTVGPSLGVAAPAGAAAYGPLLGEAGGAAPFISPAAGGSTGIGIGAAEGTGTALTADGALAGYGGTAGGAAESGGLMGGKTAGSGAAGAEGAGAAGGGSAAGLAAGPLGLAAAAYLGYQHGSKQGEKYDAEERAPARQESIAFLDKYPGALTNEGVPESQRANIGTAPIDGMGNFRFNPKTGRYEDMNTGETWYDANRRAQAQQGNWTGD